MTNELNGANGAGTWLRVFRKPEATLSLASLALLGGLVLSHGALAHSFTLGTLEIGHPWSRATPPGAKVAAGYLSVKNGGAEADRLIGASAELAGRTEIHEMSVDANGVMTMRPVEGVEVPAGGEVKLEPGGFHIMFMDLKDQPKEGVKFPGTLTFEKAGDVAVEFAVESGKPGDTVDHSAH